MITTSKILIIGALFAAISDAVWLGIFGVISAAITATVTIVLAFKTTNRKIDELKENTDGKLTELMAATSRADKAESKLEEKAEAKSEAAVIAAAVAKPAQPEASAPSAASAANVVVSKEPALNLVAKDVIVTKKSL